MIATAPLWAQGIDIVLILIVVFGIIVPLVMQVIQKLQEAQQKAGGGARPPQQRPAPAQRPADAEVEDEIGEFLRRAAERRQGGQAKPPPGQAAGHARPPAVQQPAEAILVEERPQRSIFSDLSQQVERDIDTRKFVQRSTQWERRSEQAQRKAEKHTHDVFDHPVGHLGFGPGGAGQPGPPPTAFGDEVGLGLAAGLPALLANPVSLRQAIVLTEIIQRPEHRWE